MKLSSVLKEENIIVDLASSTKYDAIKELLFNAWQGEHSYQTVEQVFDAIHEREEIKTTGIGSGIALAHCISDMVDETVGLLGISKKGIDYDSIDKQPVKFLFILIVPEVERTEYLHLLSNICWLIIDDDLRKRFLNATTPHEVMQSIITDEQSRRDKPCQ